MKLDSDDPIVAVSNNNVDIYLQKHTSFTSPRNHAASTSGSLSTYFSISAPRLKLFSHTHMLHVSDRPEPAIFGQLIHVPEDFCLDAISANEFVAKIYDRNHETIVLDYLRNVEQTNFDDHQNHSLERTILVKNIPDDAVVLDNCFLHTPNTSRFLSNVQTFGRLLKNSSIRIEHSLCTLSQLCVQHLCKQIELW